jgi:hypothetical protein
MIEVRMMLAPIAMPIAVMSGKGMIPYERLSVFCC